MILTIHYDPIVEESEEVAKIIAWILITVSALMLLAGTAGAYIISELGFYTKSVQAVSYTHLLD